MLSGRARGSDSVRVTAPFRTSGRVPWPPKLIRASLAVWEVSSESCVRGDLRCEPACEFASDRCRGARTGTGTGPFDRRALDLAGLDALRLVAKLVKNHRVGPPCTGLRGGR